MQSPESTKPVLRRAIAVTLATAVFLFAFWCVADYLHVTRYSGRYQLGWDWSNLWLVPLLACIFPVHVLLLRRERVGLAVITAAMAVMTTCVLIAIPGFAFHMRIGGGA